MYRLAAMCRTVWRASIRIGRRAGASAATLVAWPDIARGHAPLASGAVGDHAWQDALRWTFEPWVTCLLALSLALYIAGAARLWRRAGTGRGLRRWQAMAFLGGWLALVAALLSPLNALGGYLFSAHMVQHEGLMVVAAPLLILGRPLAVWAWAFPSPLRMRIPTVVRRPTLLLLWRTMTFAPTAWALHGIALWAWHIPAMFEAAQQSSWIHGAQHASFLATALLFWWTPLGERARGGHGPALLYLFTTMLHTSALGALLTLSSTIWYPSYGVTAAALGIDPVEDQQLGGLVMWMPGGASYVLVALVVAWDMLVNTRSPAPLPGTARPAPPSRRASAHSADALAPALAASDNGKRRTGSPHRDARASQNLRADARHRAKPD